MTAYKRYCNITVRIYFVNKLIRNIILTRIVLYCTILLLHLNWQAKRYNPFYYHV